MAVLTDEQSMLHDAAKSWTQNRNPLSAFRKMRDSGNPLGYDPDVWNDQVELGWPGIIIPEQFGGSNFGFFAMGLILEEIGRTLTASPLLASGIAAASAIILGGLDSQKAEWLPKIADGSVIATLAVDEGSRHAPERVATTATKSGSTYTIRGNKSFVIEGPAAGLFVVSARTSGSPGHTDGIGLFLVNADAAGVNKQPLKLIDCRGVSNLEFKDVEGKLLGAEEKGWPLLEATLDRARTGISAEMLGAASQAFETTLEYLKNRVQFGQPIGAFQALQHRAAMMFTELELSRSAVEAALQAIEADSPETPELASLAKAKIGDTLHLISNEMVQMHGGIGMTDAHDAGLFLKRARTCEAAFGNRAYHRNRYGQILGY